MIPTLVLLLAIVGIIYSVYYALKNLGKEFKESIVYKYFTSLKKVKSTKHFKELTL